MRLLTTQEFSEILERTYRNGKGNSTLGETLYVEALIHGNKNMRDLMDHASEMGDYLITWQNDLAVIKYFIDNFVEEF